MLGVAFANAILIDTSAAVALVDETDALHGVATECFEQLRVSNLMCAVDVTAHETFTRLRYNRDLARALEGYERLRTKDVCTLDFTSDDEQAAVTLLQKYEDKKLSYHDALCAAVMRRFRMFRVFSFDADFWSFGFALLPGETRPK